MAKLCVSCTQETKKCDIVKFLVFAAIGIYMFFFPVSYNGGKTIPVEMIVSYLISLNATAGQLYALIVILVAGVLPFVRKNWNKSVTNIIFTISKIIGAVVAVMVFFNVGPELVLRPNHGPFLLNALAVNVGVLVPVGAIFLTFLMNYGFIDFFGLLMRKIMRTVWKTPGRSAVDAVASFLGSTAMGVMITNQMYIGRRYNTKEAAIVVTGFSTVSVTFAVVVAKTLGIMDMWTEFFVVAYIMTFMITAITVRIPPLRNIGEEYYEGGEGLPEEPVEGNLIASAFCEGLKICGEADPLAKNILVNLKNAFNLVFEVLPNFLSIGLCGLILANSTATFDVLGYIFYPLILALHIPEPVLVAKAAVLSLVEIYLPVLVVKDVPTAAKFVVGVISVTQTIMFCSTVPCIIATKIPIRVRDLVVIWFERTIITLLLVTPVAFFLTK